MAPDSQSLISTPDAIRLVQFLPDDGTDQLRCRLEISHLDENPDYYALSYTWGPATEADERAGITDRRYRYLHCVSSGTVILITDNLRDCILRLRQQADLQTKYWIDAICIDQNDDAEKQEQVSRMGSIYASARKVIAWVGEEDSDTDSALELIKILGGLTPEELSFLTPAVLHSDEATSQLVQESALRLWISMAHFFRRLYFTRTWVIQEIILAAKVEIRCGSFTFDWKSLVYASQYLTASPWTRYVDIYPLRTQVTTKKSNHYMPMTLRVIGEDMMANEAHTFLRALIRTRRFQVGDPRDKVYAFLGIAGRTSIGQNLLTPDYSRAANEVYLLAALAILKSVDDLLLLSCVEGRDFQLLSGLPSWVPDWSCSAVIGLGIAGYKRFHAAGEARREVTCGADGRALRIKAAKLDTILEAGAIKHQYEDVDRLHEWIKLVLQLDVCYHTGQTRWSVFWRTLITDTAGAPAQHPAPDELAHSFVSWLCMKVASAFVHRLLSLEHSKVVELLADLDALSTAEFGEERPLSLVVKDYMQRYIQNRSFSKWIIEAADRYDVVFSHARYLRLFRTTMGYLGLGSQCAHVGDSVWIVPGSPVPLIFRKVDGQVQHELVGGAYVHGFMQGEALELGNLSYETIEII